MRHFRAIGGLVILLTGGEAAMAQAVPDLKGTWIPAKGAHLVEGPTKHQQSGTVPIPGDDYAHIAPTDRAVACGLLIREK